MTRKQAVAACHLAGIENDQKQFIRIYVENRLSLEVARRAFDEGRISARAWEEKEHRHVD